MNTPSDRFKDKADKIGVPLIQPLPPQKATTPNPVVAICGECGREIRKVEGYYCPNGRCPVQVKPW